MIIFKCDICYKPFEPIRAINNVKFGFSDIIDGDNSNLCVDDYSNMPKPKNSYSTFLFYHICPDCVNALRDTLWSLRNKNEESDQNE